ncbi:MAG: hypothetical protein WC728_00020 [Elusimicrobiota bacterium]
MRPLPITLLCVLMLIAQLLELRGVFYAAFQNPVRALWTFFLVAAAIASFLGLWRMRRWGVCLYLGLYAASVAAFYAFPPPESKMLDQPLLMFLVPAVYCVVVFPYWKRLS